MIFNYFDFRQILYSDYDDLFSKVFVPNEFSFVEDEIIDNLDVYIGSRISVESAKRNIEKAEFIIKDDNKVILPKGMKFDIVKKAHKDNIALFYIIRNEVLYPIDELSDNEIIGELSEFGKKLYKYMNSDSMEYSNPTFVNAYEHVLDIEKSFGIKIIPD